MFKKLFHKHNYVLEEIMYPIKINKPGWEYSPLQGHHFSYNKLVRGSAIVYSCKCGHSKMIESEGKYESFAAFAVRVE